MGNFETLYGYVVLSFLIVGSTVAEECKVHWNKVGCFHDSILDRPLKDEVLNRRDMFNHHFDGVLLDWNNWEKTMQLLACRCGEIVHDLGHSHFGLQFYGECWTGRNASTRYYKDGQAPDCIGVGYKPCDDKASTPCVGPAAVNYVYTVTPKKPTPKKEDGNYTEWSTWSKCTKTCGGGIQIRKRTCTNPSPANGGKDCQDMGKPKEVRSCNENPCLPVCKKAIELGIILDASSSIGSKNYSIAKEFVKDLIDHYEIGPNATHLGVIHYAWKPHVDFTMADSQFYYPRTLKAKIDSIVYSYGGTKTDLALMEAEKKLFCSSCGIRPDKPKVLITLTDARIPDFIRPLREASQGLKDKGVISIAIGIGNIHMAELQQIATSRKYIFVVDKVNELHKHLLSIVDASCPV